MTAACAVCCHALPDPDLALPGAVGAMAVESVVPQRLGNLRQLVQRPGTYVEPHGQQDLVGLEQQVRALEEDLRRLRRHVWREHEAQQRKVQMDLLGEAAYALSRQVVAYVHRGEPTGQLVPLSLKQLAAKHSAQGLQGQRTEHWLRATEVVGSYGMPVGDLIQADKYLRSMRSGLVHFTWQLKNNTSLEVLQQWAAVYVECPNALLAVRGLLKVLSKFFSNNKPLCPDKPISQL